MSRPAGVILIAIFLLSLSSASFATTEAPLFPDSVLVFGAQPREFRKADFNDDGLMDLAMSGWSSLYVSILLGHGDGTFDEVRVEQAYTWGLGVGDFDEDGYEDFVVSDWSDDVTLHRGNGDGTFGPSQRFFAGWEISSISVADLDRDGHLDLVNVGANDCALVFGDGNGGFGPPVDLGSAHSVNAGIGDFNGDGHPDIAVATYHYNPALRVYYGNGDRTFLQGPLVGVGESPSFITVHDFNRDGLDDLAVANYDLDDVAVFLSGGSWFNGATRYAAGMTPRDLDVADLNSDDFDDLVVGNRDEDRLSVLFGRSGGQFDPAVHIPTPHRSGFTEIEDFDQDGEYDLAVLGTFTSVFYMLFGRGDGTFVPPLGRREFATGEHAHNPFLGDFNEDGATDVALSNPDADTVSVLLGDGMGNLGAPQAFPVGDYPLQIDVRLIDGDDHLDLVTLNLDSADVSVLLGRGDGTFWWPGIASPVDPEPRQFTLADFNDDGLVDMAMTHGYPVGSYVIYFGNGDGTFTEGASGGTGADPGPIVAADVNGDTLVDLVVGNADSGDLSVVLAYSPAEFYRETRVPFGDIFVWDQLQTADLNSDNQADLVFCDPLKILRGNGDGTFTETFQALAGRPAAIRDLDGDGHLDVAAPGGGGVAVFLGRGDATFRVHGGFSIGGSGPHRGISAGRMDGDGRHDLVASVYPEDSVVILLNAGPSSFTFERDKISLGWPHDYDAVSYNVYRGLVSELVDTNDDGYPDSDYGVCLSDVDPDTTDNDLIDTEIPPPADGFFYLMSIVDEYGERGLGDSSPGFPRMPAEVCP